MSIEQKSPSHAGIEETVRSNRRGSYRYGDGREVLAMAKGVLIATRGYGDAEAFDELLDVSRRHHVSVLRAAKALVDLATHRQQEDTTPVDAPDPLSFDEWAGLLTR
ncbi:MAG: ANTAR domain-containing protein [Rhodococcus sp. (in: high G+C Gram-positive bacteria)]|uniref:ANTAR domain-containing protein n=1 Tax=Rhodococcus sp. TaxID=1831 RepID=UPI003BAF51A1